MVVVVNVTLYASPQIVQIAEFVEVIELSFECPKEAFHGSSPTRAATVPSLATRQGSGRSTNYVLAVKD